MCCKNSFGETALHRTAWWARDAYVARVWYALLCVWGDSPVFWFEKRLIGAGAKVEEEDGMGWTALALAINNHHHKLAGALLDAGAELANIANSGTLVPGWAREYNPRRRFKRSLIIFVGILRRRFVVLNAATASGNRIPLDIVKKLVQHICETRVDPRWDDSVVSAKRACSLQ